MPELIGSHEAAELLGVSKQYVTSIADRLGGKKVGTAIVFPRATVEAEAAARTK